MNHYQQPLTPYEQRLRDEVVYLHSLWHQGPPSLNPNPILHRPNSTYYPSRNLHVFNSTSFKKTKTNPHKNQNPRNNKPTSVSRSDPQPDLGSPWPVNPPPPSSPPATSGWPPFKDRSSPETRILSDTDESKVASMRIQKKVVTSCNEFFAKRVDFDGEDEHVEVEDDCLCDDMGIEESEEFNFFFSLFVENRELRDFYEKGQDNGDFCCLVCGGVGEKIGKMFKGCLGLVQHSITILKTKRKRAHRAFGLVICRVLGWDFSRLPTIVLKGERLSQSLVNLGQTLKSLEGGDGKKVVEDTDTQDDLVLMDEKFLGEDEGSNANEELVNEMPNAGRGEEQTMECMVEPKDDDDDGDEADKLDKKCTGTNESGDVHLKARLTLEVK